MNKKIVLVIILLISLNGIFALDVPGLKGRVNDYTGTVSSSDTARIDSILEEIERSTSSQVAVLIIDSLEGDSLEDFSLRVVDQWQLGKKDLDNGVLLLVSLNDKKIRIEVGYGLEGSLTDAKSSYIIRKVIAPYFKSGDMVSGLEQGVLAIGGVISQDSEITPEDIRTFNNESESSGEFPYAILFFILFFVLSSFKRLGRVSRTGNRHGSGSRLVGFMILDALLSGSSRSSSGGGSGFGGFSGGGGGFGGGGASGGW